MSEPIISPKKPPFQIFHIIFYIIFFGSVALSFYLDDILYATIVFFVLIGINYILKYIEIRRARREETPTKKESIIGSKVRIVGVIMGIVFFFALLIGFIVAELMEDELLGLIVNAVPVMICFLVTIYLNYKWHLNETAKPNIANLAPRSRWIDDFRGLVVIFLIIASLTWEFSGGHILGIGDPSNPPIGPTWLNHGWKFASFTDWPNLITIIDIGQQILMFIIGFVGALTFYKHAEKQGQVAAILHIIRRFVALMAMEVFISGLLEEGTLTISEWPIMTIFYTDTLSNLAWGTLFSLLLVAILKKKPDVRFIIALGIMLIYSIMYAIPDIRVWEWKLVLGGDLVTFFKVPWNTINHIAIAILGTCTYDWYQWIATKENPDAGWPKRILPVATLMLIGAYLIDYIEPAEHHDATTVIAMLAIGISQLMLYIFYNFEKHGYRIIGLSTFGKNIMMMFLYTGLHAFYQNVLDMNLLHAIPILALFVVGIIPILYQYIVAWVMDKFKIYMKF